MSDYIKKIRTDDGDKQIDYEGLANKPKIDQTYNPESENPQSGKAVAEAVYTKAPIIIDSAEISSFTMVYGAIEGTPIVAAEIKGESTQDTSGGLAPNTPCEIISSESPTLYINNDIYNDTPTITFAGITLHRLNNVYYDYLKVEDGRIKLYQKVFYKKDFSDVEFTPYDTHGFSIDITDWKIKPGTTTITQYGLCNMLSYSSSANSTVANHYTIDATQMCGKRITEIANGMSVEDWKTKYAKDMVLLAPSKKTITTDVTEQFKDFFNIKFSDSTFEAEARNCSSCVISYYRDTKNYIDTKINEIAMALVANA